MDNLKSKKHLPIIEGASRKCYDAVEECGVACQRKSCRQWIEHEAGMNCMKVTTRQGPLTLREIGKIYGLTRMRICQIEKNAYQKIKRITA